MEMETKIMSSKFGTAAFLFKFSMPYSKDNNLNEDNRNFFAEKGIEI